MKRGVALILVLTICSLMLIIVAATGTFVRSSADALDRHLEVDAARARIEDVLHLASGKIAVGEKVSVSERFNKDSLFILAASPSQQKFAVIARVDAFNGRPACYYRGDAVIRPGEKRVRILQLEQTAWDESSTLIVPD